MPQLHTTSRIVMAHPPPHHCSLFAGHLHASHSFVRSPWAPPSQPPQAERQSMSVLSGLDQAGMWSPHVHWLAYSTPLKL